MNDWLSEAAGLYTTKDYIITGNKTLSFQELNEMAISLAHYLQKKYKVKEGDIAAILSENNIDFIHLLFALWKLGAVPVPLNTRLNDSETNNLIKFLTPPFIFKENNINRHVEYQSAQIIRIRSDFINTDATGLYLNDGLDLPGKDINENNTALILFTSGTSGNPKGVQLSFHNLKTSFNNSNTVLKHAPYDKWIASLPFYHIGGFSIIARTLLSGASLIITLGSKTEDLVDAIVTHRPTFLSLVSKQLKRLINMGIRPNNELKYVLLGGGYIEDSLIDEAINAGWPIGKVYGSTETSSLITFLDCKKENNKKASAGKPLANNQIFIVNGEKELFPPNNMGEIAIKSESCAKVYYNYPAETNIKFRDGLYYTGDLGYIDEEGYLFIDSRMDDLIISGGENINPLEIETALLEFTGIQNASVFGQEDNEWGHIVSAAIIPVPGFNISETELKNFLQKKISSFKLPKKYYFMNQFPMGPLGKVQKNKLKEIVKNN